MATMNVSLPDALREWIDAQVKSGRYATASDYVRELVRDHQEYRLKLARLDELLEEGERSGVSDRSFEVIMADIRAKHAPRAAHG